MREWLARKDSNLQSPDPESGALPFGHSPAARGIVRRGATLTQSAPSGAPNAGEATIGRISRYFLRLGTLGFGGPVALAGYMQRDLVEDRGWVSSQEYRDGLALAQMMPGPLAAQLGMWLAYVRTGVKGATIASLAFVAPPFVLVVAIAWIYVALGRRDLGRVAVLRRRAGGNRDHRAVGVPAPAADDRAGRPAGRGGAGGRPHHVLHPERDRAGVHRGGPRRRRGPRQARTSSDASLRADRPSPPRLPAAIGFLTPLFPVAATDPGLLGAIFVFFIEAGAFIFGSGLAIVPFLHQGVVVQNGWLTEQQFLDAVAVGLITPGPVVITAAFVGFIVAGLPGATVASLAVFLPAYLLVVLPGRWFLRYKDAPAIRAFVAGVSAAAAGAIVAASVILGQQAIRDADRGRDRARGARRAPRDPALEAARDRAPRRAARRRRGGGRRAGAQGPRRNGRAAGEGSPAADETPRCLARDADVDPDEPMVGAGDREPGAGEVHERIARDVGQNTAQSAICEALAAAGRSRRGGCPGPLHGGNAGVSQKSAVS